MKFNRKSRKKAGFSLLEVMFSTAIAGTALGFAGWFWFESVRASFLSEEKLQINSDVRELTNTLVDLGRSADYFYMYSAYTSSVKNYQTIDGEDVYGAGRLGDGQTGDLLILVYEDSSSMGTSGYPINKIVGIYRENTGTEAPVKMFTVESADISDPLADPEASVPNVSDIPNHETIVELAEGLANGSLFYNFNDTSIMVNGKIVHGNDVKQVTDTYNLTIKPRGGTN